MPFLSLSYRSLQKVSGNADSRSKAILLKETVIRTARPHKHANLIYIDKTEKKACSAFFKCSLTIEASLALPLFVFAVFILVYPLKIIDAEIRYQAELEELTKNVSVSGYLEKTASDLIGENIQEYSRAVTGVITAADAAFSSDADILGVTVPTEIILPADDNEIVKVSAEAYVSFPFSDAINIGGTFVRFVSRRRAWTGRDGGAGSAYKETVTDVPEGEDKTVWVAANAPESGRYHLSPECHYIANTVTAVPASSIPSLRSADGSRYKPCSSCHPGTAGTVFIFKSGGSYHATAQCKAVQAYVTETAESEAQKRGLSPCSYCLAHYR